MMQVSRDHYRPSKDRPWDYDRLAHYGTIDFFLRKGYDIKQIAVELNRRQEWVEARIAELPGIRAQIDRLKESHAKDGWTMFSRAVRHVTQRLA